MPFCAFDCEGPLTLNDNAFEFAKAIIPRGDYFFTQISRFDDYLADIKKRPGYKAGNTLKLILPFLKLFGATNSLLQEFSRKTLLFLPGVPEVIPRLIKVVPFFIISTSYRPYLQALCERLNFPPENVFCTEVDLDKRELSTAEKKVLQKLYEEILGFPPIEIPTNATSERDLPEDLVKVLERLEEIFFEIIWNMDCGAYLREVNPIGGEEKARVCSIISEELSTPLSEGLYCGDSITDCQALELMKSNKGISLAFNANRYALRSAEFYALSRNAYIFEKVIKLCLDGGRDTIEKFSLRSTDEEFDRIPTEQDKFSELVKRSESLRKIVRGEAIGALG